MINKQIIIAKAKEEEKMVNFKTLDRISEILDRAKPLREKMGIPQMTLMMDLEAAHGDIGLDSDKLLSFDEFNFAHDICGIVSHIDRNTGKLKDYFVPRCASK